MTLRRKFNRILAAHVPNVWRGMGKGYEVERALLMSKRPTKVSPKVIVGSEADSTDGFTKRILLSLVVDVTELRKTTERLQVQVFTLAKAHGIVPPNMND